MLFITLVSLSLSSPPTATVADGVLSGLWEGSTAAFLGVPYAKAPTGELRWSSPQKAEPWATPKDATKFGGECSQYYPMFTHGALIGSEDCLFLNVYAPGAARPKPGADPARRGAPLLPVMLWIHGGGYEGGAGSWYNASELVDQLGGAAIAVTINYRLSVFGFLGGDDLRARSADNSTGNYGLQDQRLAMQWVQDNAAAFGGDASRVTIFGESAGAGSVSCHLCAQKSRGLFARAGMQSSSFTTGAATLHADAQNIWGTILKKARCSDAQCMASKTTAELMTAKAAMPACCDFLYPFLPWAPVVDGVELRQHPFHCVANTARVEQAALAGSPVPLAERDATDTVATVPILLYIT
jgi:para-nitrobenzyl esterase